MGQKLKTGTISSQFPLPIFFLPRLYCNISKEMGTIIEGSMDNELSLGLVVDWLLVDTLK